MADDPAADAAPDETVPPPGGPLAGLKVLELGQLIAGPFAAKTLADFGAEVIKIEPPGSGDQTMLTGAGGSDSGGRPLGRVTGGRPISASVALIPSSVLPPRTIVEIRRKASLYQRVECSPSFGVPSQ